MRGTYKDRVCPEVGETPVTNHYVVGATSKLEIPIRSKFLALLSSGGKLLGRKKTVIYVVDNNNGNDIMCDIIVGRPTLAESDYHCIDTKTGTLFNKINNEKEVQCAPACIVQSKHGRIVIPKELYKSVKTNQKNKLF